MLGKKTRKAFKDLNAVGNSAIVRYPLTSIIQLDRALISFINLEELGEEPFDEFGIYYLSEFLSLIDLFEDGVITKEDNIIKLKNDNSSQKYKTSDLDTMEIFDMPAVVLEKISASPSLVTFDIKSEEIERIKKVVALLKLKSFIVDASDKLNIVACNLSENGVYMNESINTIEGAVISEPTRVVFDTLNISKLPSVDFKVSVTRNENTGNYISLWKATDEPISIIVAVQKTL